MDGSKKQPAKSLLGTIARWLGAFESSMDMRPEDYLELRVAHLERRLAELIKDKSATGLQDQLQSFERV